MANSKVGVAVSSILREERACISRFCKRGYIISRHSICQEAVSSLKFLKFNLGNVSLWDQAQVTVVEELEGYERRRGEKRSEKRREKRRKKTRTPQLLKRQVTTAKGRFTLKSKNWRQLQGPQQESKGVRASLTLRYFGPFLLDRMGHLSQLLISEKWSYLRIHCWSLRSP